MVEPPIRRRSGWGEVFVRFAAGRAAFLRRKPAPARLSYQPRIEIQDRLCYYLGQQIGMWGGNPVIRAFRKNDLAAVMRIWLDTNIKAHSFIPKDYWAGNYAAVKEMLPQAEVYVYEDGSTRQIMGFIGLTGSYIAGVFIKEAAQSKGIGKQLLDYVKGIRADLNLSVYQKNVRAISFYQREGFTIRAENVDENTNEKEFTMNWSK